MRGGGIDSVKKKGRGPIRTSVVLSRSGRKKTKRDGKKKGGKKNKDGEKDSAGAESGLAYNRKGKMTKKTGSRGLT